MHIIVWYNNKSRLRPLQSWLIQSQPRHEARKLFLLHHSDMLASPWADQKGAFQLLYT